MITKLDEFIRESVRIEIEKNDLLSIAKAKIQKILKNFPVAKIGKTGNIETRFDVAYKDKGYKELIPICSSSKKKVIDELEEELISIFQNRTENEQVGGGRMASTQDYWIYVVY